LTGEINSRNRGLNGLLDFTDFSFTNQQFFSDTSTI